ncbi:MAG: phosphoadenosine phosphosulfate reductase family protein [Bacteroidota bacterium]
MPTYQQITSSFYRTGSAFDGPDLRTYDKILIAFSGGKDSWASWLAVLEQLVSIGMTWTEISRRVEFWHHLIDGREGSKLMDWPCSEDYARKCALAFGIPIFFSWKTGGFEGEMNRENSPTAPTKFETPEGHVVKVGGQGRPGTRLQFPQVSANLQTRWCSSYLKIDVMAISIRNQYRFNNARTLVVTGERGEESSQRAGYDIFEPHRTDKRDSLKLRRHVDHWRPVLDWLELEVWAVLQEYRIRVHPAYYLGFSRVSCQKCIFGNRDVWATNYQLDPEGIEKIARAEERFGKTIKRNTSVREMIGRGTSFMAGTLEDQEDAMSEIYTRKIFMDKWRLPAGAFKGGSCGPV